MKKTLENLSKAYVGECQARNRYTFYAKKASKEGYEQIAGVFMETAEQEKTHAKRLFEHINELIKTSGENMPEINIETSVPTTYETTAMNLRAAIAGETHEYETMYPEFAQTAKEEGLAKISNRLSSIAKAENHHKDRYEKLLIELDAGTLFKKEKEVSWVCRECGYLHIGNEAPEICPSCDHPKAYYQVQCENY